MLAREDDLRKRWTVDRVDDARWRPCLRTPGDAQAGSAFDAVRNGDTVALDCSMIGRFALLKRALPPCQCHKRLSAIASAGLRGETESADELTVSIPVASTHRAACGPPPL